MSYVRHHAIMVTGWDKETVETARAEAFRIFDRTAAYVSPVTPEAVNRQVSFFIAPDGSKEGRQESNDCDAARAKLLDWLRASEGWLSYVEVEFGGDGNAAEITADSHRDGKED